MCSSPGETLSGIVGEAPRRHVGFPQAQKAFIERGLASAAAARKAGKYVSSVAMLRKLSRRLEKARKRETNGSTGSPFLRELIISFRDSGHVALLEIEAPRTLTLLALRLQRDEGYH